MNKKDLLSKLSVIIPAYNEELAIESVLNTISQTEALQQSEIIVVNDGSTDRTAELVKKFPNVILINRKRNLGYGASIVQGIRRATRNYLVWFDSDGQHRVEDLILVGETLIREDLDYCVGIRDHRSHEVVTRKFGKFILRKLVQFATAHPIEDFNSGLRGFKREVIEQYLSFLPKGFGASTVTTLLMHERNHEGMDMPIIVKPRVGISQVRQIRDGLRTTLIILRIYILFKPLRFFGAIGLLLVLSGSIYGSIKTITEGLGFPVFGMLVIFSGIQAIFFGLLADQLSMIRLDAIDRGKR